MKDVKKKIWRRRGPAVLVLCLAVIVQGCAGYPADKDGGHREVSVEGAVGGRVFGNLP